MQRDVKALDEIALVRGAFSWEWNYRLCTAELGEIRSLTVSDVCEA